MVLEKVPFRSYTIGESQTDTFTVRLNIEEREELKKNKKILEQSKDSTAFKQLAKIGAIVLHDPKMSDILGVIFKNKRNNKRSGVAEFE